MSHFKARLGSGDQAQIFGHSSALHASDNPASPHLQAYGRSDMLSCELESKRQR